jgi:hypothetical protein
MKKNFYKFKMVGSKMLNETLSQGYGKHSEEECIIIIG